jgi:hypothetical protein
MIAEKSLTSMEDKMFKKIRKLLIFSITALVLFQVNGVYSRGIPYTIVTIENISRYNEDRLAFQHIETPHVEYQLSKTDNSIASLLVVRDNKMFLFKDGFDDPKVNKTKRLILQMENKLIPDLWTNKIDGLPDYLQVTERRVELQKKMAGGEKDKDNKAASKSLGTKFDGLYKNIRDKLILKHVKVFKTLMINRRESGLYVVRKPLPKRVYDTGPTKYFISVTGKTIDEKRYYAEDSDGDGITETFSVQIPDGFHWGYKSGPNIIFIYKNKQEDLAKLIGKIAHEAYWGTPEEEKAIEKSFIKEGDVSNMIDDIYRMTPDQEKLLKSE